MSDSFSTPWTVACQAPLSMGFPRQEYCSGYSFPSQGNLLNLGIQLMSPALQADSLQLSHWGSPILYTAVYMWSILVAQWQRVCLQYRRCRRRGLSPWVRQIPWRRTWRPTPAFLPGQLHGQRSLVGHSP